MGYQKKQTTRPIIQAPTGLTQDNMLAIRNGFIDHFKKVLTPEILIAHRKSSYAVVINASSNGVKLEKMVGSENNKLMTTDIIYQLLENMAFVHAITVVGTPVSATYNSSLSLYPVR